MNDVGFDIVDDYDSEYLMAVGLCDSIKSEVNAINIKLRNTWDECDKLTVLKTLKDILVELKTMKIYLT